ncbi:MAG: rod shape-determining protein MreD [Lachnospiraceae bacterium]|nr:rod shape-determining protein MreD [Lachnospiraceae bacterium]
MELKPFAKKVFSYVLLVIVYFLLHTSVFSKFTLGGIAPNILVILVSTIGFMRGGNYALYIGMASGLLLDMFSGSYFGMYAFIYLIIAFFNGMLRQWFFGDDMKLPLLLIGFSDLLYGMMVYGCIYLLRGRYDIGYYFMHVIIPEIIYTVLVSLVLYFPIYYFEYWMNKTEKRSERKFV